MKAIKLTLAGVLLAASCSFALAQGAGGAGSGGGAGGEPPKASDANPPSPIKKQPGEARVAPMKNKHTAQRTHRMRSHTVGMPNNSTGNMNTKGTGKGTTGTGGPGGSGNK